MTTYSGATKTLVFQDDTSHKYYAITQIVDSDENHFALFNWGRYATDGQYKLVHAPTGWALSEMAMRKLTEKSRKGYVVAGGDESFTDVELDELEVHLPSRAVDLIKREQKILTPVVKDTIVDLTEQIQQTIQTATVHDNPVDSVVALSGLNAKMEQLRAEVDKLEAGVEFANATVRARF